MRSFKYYLLIAALILVCGCSPEGVEEETRVINELKLDPAKVTMTVGETLTLKATTTPAYDDLTFNWIATNPNIANVDEYGCVTAHAPGNTNIRCEYGSECSALTIIKVVAAPSEDDDNGDEPGNPGNTPGEEPQKITFDSPMSQDMIFSSRQLAYPGTVMQCFDFYGDGEDDYIYFSQCAGDSATGNKWMVVLSRVKRGKYGDATRSGETMKLRWFGHGTVICVEHAADGQDYVWTDSNSTLVSGSYSHNKTISRIRFQPNTTFDHYTGEQFYLNSYKDMSGKSWTVYGLQVNIDFDARRMFFTAASSGRRHMIVYDLDQVMALKEEQVTLTRTWGGEANTNTTLQSNVKSTVLARNLGSLTPISSFQITNNQNTDPTYSKTWSISYQGHAIRGEKLYWYEGNVLESKKGSGVYDNSIAFVETFDYKGNRLAPRAKIYAASDFANMFTLLNLNDNHYCEAEGIQVRPDGKIYLGITTHIAGKTSSNRLSTILRYDSDR